MLELRGTFLIYVAHFSFEAMREDIS